MRLLALVAVLILLVLLAGLVLRLLNPLPPLEPRNASRAFTDTADTALGRYARAGMEANPGLNGVQMLEEGRGALAARVALARAAERSIDAQYYIWHDDISGKLLMRELLAAADRGVRVRLLLDDNGTAGLDGLLAALGQHPKIEVRLFNPFVIREPKFLGYVMDFPRLNRRMHNKAFIADNQAAVIGGRNVGDEYFGASRENQFEDLDLMAVGPVIADLSEDFDRYWESGSSHRAASILPSAAPGALEQLHARLEGHASGALSLAYGKAIAERRIGRTDVGGGPPMLWAPIRMVSDDPAKGLAREARSDLLAVRLGKLVGEPADTFSLVSAYFVPTDSGRDWLVGLARRGVEVSVMTNALEATDVAAVHAGYARHRKALLEAGVRLWELKAAPHSSTRLSIGFGSGSRARPVLASSGSSLHAKTFAVDGERIFVGSFNFDPRSVALNTELGFLVDEPIFARGLHAMLAQDGGSHAYEVRLGPGGDLQWMEATAGGQIVHESEPGTRWHQRAIISLMSLLPIDWLL